MRNVCLLLLFLYSLEGTRIWHVTDFHWDPKYQAGGNPQDMCHNNGTSPNRASPVGDYLCDSPLVLVQSAVHFLAKNVQPGDIVVWTGDEPPHVKELSEEAVLSIVKNITFIFQSQLPGIPVYACLGNHDYYPKGQLPPSKNIFYEQIGNLWRKWIGNEAVLTFSEFGYYEVYISNHLKLLSLNTAFYYTQNKLTENMEDPGCQFTWVAERLSQARAKGDKVILIGHVPPGAFERKAYNYWFYPHFNSKYISLIQQFSDVIVLQLFAHQHSDSFRVFYDTSGSQAVSLMLLAPSVTPWKTTLEGVSANNPSIRLLNFSEEECSGYTQYYVDLEKAQKTGNLTWELEYNVHQAYGITRLNASNFAMLVDNFRTNDDKFQRYYQYNAVLFNQTECNSECRKQHICSITHIDFGKYAACMQSC